MTQIKYLLSLVDDSEMSRQILFENESWQAQQSIGDSCQLLRSFKPQLTNMSGQRQTLRRSVCNL